MLCQWRRIHIQRWCSMYRHLSPSGVMPVSIGPQSMTYVWHANHLTMDNLVHSTAMRYLSMSCVLAKAKDKKGKGKQAMVRIDEAEMSELMDVAKFRERLNAVLDKLQTTYVTSLTVRTSIGAIETLSVSFDGDHFPLNELGQVARKSPTLVVISCGALPDATEHVLKALHNAGMGLNPQQQGTTIYVQIPKVTREHRESLAKSAKAAFNTAKDRLRDVQNKQLKSLKDKADVSEDLLHRVQAQATALAHEYIVKAEKLLHSKTDELLKEK